MNCPVCNTKMMIIHKPTGTKYMCVKKGCKLSGEELTGQQIKEK